MLPRVIPCLLLRDRGLVKTVQFKKDVYVGDPVNAVRIFNDKEVDELILLDIDATRDGRGPDFEVIAEIAGECFMPVAYGGGIRSFRDVRDVIRSGIEKVVINSAAYESHDVIAEASSVYGAQAVVGSIDVRKPFLAFLGGLLNRKSLAALALVFSLVFFYSIGVKAPIAYAGLAYFVGLGVRSGRLMIFFDAVVALSVILFLGFLLEYSVNQYSEIAEYFHRRVFVVPGFDIQHYMELIFRSGDALWSPWYGLNSDLETTFLVGAVFFGNVQANVNTNAFTLALASGGIPEYLAVLALVAGFLKALDALYEGSGNAGYLYLGFLYSLLITEQGATTALASSGIALLFIILLLSGKGWTQEDVRSGSSGSLKFRFLH